MVTQFACQPLGHDQGHRGGDIKGWHPHVHHPGEGFGGGVGVKGGEHQVASLGGLDGYFCRLQIADLPHHHHIRVLPQEGAQGAGKGQPSLGVDLHLIDAGQVDLHRIFGGRNIDLGGVENI